MQTETINLFYQKFKSLESDEIEIIAKKNKKYTLEARLAAITILKERNFKSQHIENVENEVLTFKNSQNKILNNKFIEDEKIITFLKSNIKNQKFEFMLDNGNELQIMKISDNYFQIRIEHSKSFLSPVLILKIENNKNIKYFPFFYYFPFLLFIALSLMLLGYSYYENNFVPDFLISLLGFLLLFTVAVQIIQIPFMYKIIIEKFKNKILKESHVS